MQVSPNDNPAAVGFALVLEGVFIGCAWTVQISTNIAGIISPGDVGNHGNSLRKFANWLLTSDNTWVSSSAETIWP